MTFGKAAALVIALVAAIAVGVAIGPYVTHRQVAGTEAPGIDRQPSTTAKADRAPAPRRSARHAMRPRAAEREAAAAVSIPATEPALHKRLKPVLNRGTKLEIAADGFRDGEQFAAVAHAARNTEVPFMVLKHQVVDEGKSLSAAIKAAKPDVNAAAEARRAREQAKSDLVNLES